MKFELNPNEKNYLADLAQDILHENVYSAGLDCGYTAASGKMALHTQEKRWLYPFQWLWDTFFIAAWNTDTKQSLTDIEKYMAVQEPGGFCGHIRYNREILNNKSYFPPPDIYYPNGKLPATGEIGSKITQPPNLGYGLYELAKKLTLDISTIETLKMLFTKVLNYHRYLYTHRMQQGCLVTIHPWEAGDDNSPKWDSIFDSISKEFTNSDVFRETIYTWLEAIGITYDRVDTKLILPNQRPIDAHYLNYLFLIFIYGQWHWDEATILEKSPFRVADPMTNSILLRSNKSLAKLARMLSITDTAIYEELVQWTNLTQDCLESLWSEEHGMYMTKDLTKNILIPVEAISGLTPLFSTTITKDKADLLATKIEDLKKSTKINYMVPSTFPSQESIFEPDRYWRGPVWIITNELVADGLSFYGHAKLAAEIKDTNLQLVMQTLDEHGGFYEYYNPITGGGLGSAKQSWTAAAILKALDPPNIKTEKVKVAVSKSI